MKSKIFSARFIFITSAILLAAMSRLLPHIPNFTPIAAMALFGGAYFKDKRLAVVIPLIAMLLSDAAIQLLFGWGFHNTMIYVYIGILLTSIIGMRVGRKATISSIAIGSITASILFFIITNFGVWAATGYQMGIAGLSTTYVMGIPFFAPTLIGDLFFNSVLFGAFYLAQIKFPILIKA